MNKSIMNINFKKVVIGYILILFVVIIFITIFAYQKYNDKIKLIFNYEQVKETFHKKNYQDKIIEKIDALAKLNDIVDVVILENNQITYTTNNIYQNNLTKISENKKYYTDQNNNIYKLSKEEKFFINLFIDKSEDDEYNEEFNQTSYNKKYTISYLNNKKNNSQIVILSEIKPVPNSNIYLKLIGSLLIFMLMLYWIIVALMVYQNALKTKLNYSFWTILTLFTNLLGVIIYLIYKKTRITCKKCSASNTKDSLYCTNCGEKLNESCKKCHKIISKKDAYCKNCGTKLK